MKKITRTAAFLYFVTILSFVAGPSSAFSEAAKSPIDPCLACHMKETPKVVKQWQAGKHSKVGVKCYVCHFAEADNPDGMEHNGFFVVTGLKSTTCESCHPENGAELLKQFSKGDGAHP
jgi:hypothetical protein